jgi:hypothetical protein
MKWIALVLLTAFLSKVGYELYYDSHIARGIERCRDMGAGNAVFGWNVVCVDPYR